MDFRSRLRAGPPVLLDGAIGTELTRRGVDTGLPLWSTRALLDAPDVLREIHRDYVQAGAELLTANTFRTGRRTLHRAGMPERSRELTRLAVEIAREATREAAPRAATPGPTAPGEVAPGVRSRPVWVAGSMAPLEDCYEPSRVPPERQLEDEHGEMAATLGTCGIDVVLVETMNTVREARAATAAACATGLPTVVGLVCDRQARLLSGEPIGDAVAALEPLGPDVIAVNCTPTPTVARALRALVESARLPVGAYGNIGYADDDQGWVNTDAVQPEAYVRYATEWLDLGVRVVGGCCGTGPAHIIELRRAIDRATGRIPGW
jgi:S-methylmethionine-dependent homocysteine/selenocysteine methylase